MTTKKEETQRDTFALETTASVAQRTARDELAELFMKSPLPQEDLLFNLGLYTRSSLLVKYLVMNDLYDRIEKLPGALIEFGVWWGQNLVLLENLRAIHEPFNKQRTILGFDTFSGYKHFSERTRGVLLGRRTPTQHRKTTRPTSRSSWPFMSGATCWVTSAMSTA